MDSAFCRGRYTTLEGPKGRYIPWIYIYEMHYAPNQAIIYLIFGDQEYIHTRLLSAQWLPIIPINLEQAIVLLYLNTILPGASPKLGCSVACICRSCHLLTVYSVKRALRHTCRRSSCLPWARISFSRDHAARARIPYRAPRPAGPFCSAFILMVPVPRHQEFTYPRPLARPPRNVYPFVAWPSLTT